MQWQDAYLTVRPSVYHAPAKHIINVFSPSGSQTILVFFRTKRYGNIPTGRRMQMSMKKSRFSTNLRFIAEVMQDRGIVTMEDE